MDVFAMAFRACEELMEGLELEKLPASSAVLRCLRIARLLQDEEALIWLRYELGGYPRNPDGTFPGEVMEIARKHGRTYFYGGAERVITALAAELEKKLEEHSLLAAELNREERFRMAFTAGIPDLSKWDFLQSQMTGSTARDQRQLLILRSEYYSYTYRKYTELSLGSVTGSVFASYRTLATGDWNSLDEEDIYASGRLAVLVREDPLKNAAEVLNICRNVTGHILEKTEKSSVTLDGCTAAELSLHQQRLDSHAAAAQSGQADAADIYGCAIRTYLLAGELIRRIKNKAEHR